MTDFQRSYRQFVSSYYTKQYFTGANECGAYKDYIKDKPFVIRNVETIVNKFNGLKKNDRILDVGCAMGYLVEDAVQNGIDAYGFDASGYAVSHAVKHIQSRLQVATVDEVNYPEKSFRLITMIDVLEHLQDPRQDLIRLRSFLRDDGRLIVATGNAGSLFARFIGRYWTFYNPPQHLFFFNKSTITRLFREAGFEPVRWRSMGKWLSLGYMAHLLATTTDIPMSSCVKKSVDTVGISRVPVYIPLHDNMVVEIKKKLP